MTTLYAEEVKQLSQSDHNNHCIDCSAKNTQWASLSYGIFLCMECASIHRGMGVRISVVKSINLDKWTEEGLLRMKLGGNKQFKEFLINNELMTIPTSEKYKMDAVKDYKDTLQDKIEQAMPNLKKKPAVNKSSTYTEQRQPNKTYSAGYNNQSYNSEQNYSAPPNYNTSSNFNSTFSSSDLKSTVSNAFYKISDFVSENAVYLKDKSVHYGSKLNESVLKPSTAYIKEKGKAIYSKSTKKDEEYSTPTTIKNKKIDNPGKWD